MNGLRAIDKQRIQAQFEFANRITRGGEVDLEKAVAERMRLAERVEGKRLAFIAWMKKQGYNAERRKTEMARFDKLLAELRRDPAEPVALGLAGMLGGL